MKKKLLVAISLPWFTLLGAQQLKGTITYETRTNPVYQSNGVIQNLPPRIKKFELLFAGKKSVFKNIPSTDEDQKFESNGNSIGLITNNELQIQFHDFEKNESLRSVTVGTKNYVEESSIRDMKWVILEGKMTVLGFPCRKATGTAIEKYFATRVDGEKKEITITPKADTIKVIAWFTESIPLPIGPSKYTGLPGAILRVENMKGRSLFEALSVTGIVKQKELEAGIKGKRISGEHLEIEERKYKEASTRVLNGW